MYWNHMYKPLPKYLTIKESKIDGLGLFALQDIEKNTTIGVSHVKHDDYLHGLIRTPLGGFVNHTCLLYTSPSPRDRSLSRMPSSA